MEQFSKSSNDSAIWRQSMISAVLHASLMPLFGGGVGGGGAGGGAGILGVLLNVFTAAAEKLHICH